MADYNIAKIIMDTYPRVTKENLSKYVAKIRTDPHWYESEYIRYYAAYDMQSNEAMKVNGYWLTKEGEILSKGETLNERWIINNQRA